MEIYVAFILMGFFTGVVLMIIIFSILKKSEKKEQHKTYNRRKKGSGRSPELGRCKYGT